MKWITFSSSSNLNNGIYKNPPRSLLEGLCTGKVKAFTDLSAAHKYCGLLWKQ